MRINHLIFLPLILFIACVETPTPQKNNIGELGEHGAYILCEGLYGQNNSTLSRYDFTFQKIYNNIFQTINDKYLGDTANDIVIKGDTTFIVISTLKMIILIETKTGKLITEIVLKEAKYPRKLAILNDSLLLVTDLYSHCFWFVNYIKSEVVYMVPTGPAPEGIAIFDNYIFVANSGFGDYLANEPKAGTISVFDIQSLNKIKVFTGLPNIIELKIAKNSEKLYARYNNLPKFKDSLGGIVEIDLKRLTETRRWVDRAGQMAFNSNDDTLFYLCDSGVKLIDLNKNNSVQELIIKKSKQTDYWYSIAFHENFIWVGNAKDYQSHGEILIYDLKNPDNLKEKFKVGLNPNTIVFF